MKDAELLICLDILGPYPKGWEIWPKKDKASSFNEVLVTSNNLIGREEGKLIGPNTNYC